MTLTATPAAGSRFVGWSGACAGSGNCTLEVGESQSLIGADFETITSGGGETGGGGTGGSDAAGGSTDRATATPTPTPTPPAPACRSPGRPFGRNLRPKPEARPGCPGIRAKVGVSGPSSVRVTGTVIYGAGKARRIDLGTIAYHGSGARNLRFAIPAVARPDLPLGSVVWVSLAVSATPDSAGGCATPPGAVAQKLKLKVVKVLYGPQSGVS